ncbi:MAG: endonuclease [Bacteroidota bacterium]
MAKELVIAFYNLENLFDTRNDPHTLDDDFTPSGFKRWKERKLRSKIKKLGKAISRIGDDETLGPPVVLGVAEVENSKVMDMLLSSKHLRSVPYDYVHFDSPDERGIDTSLVYNTEYFEVLHAEPLPLIIEDSSGDRDWTRDILYVEGKLQGERIHLFVNHWPSRREGVVETAPSRIKAANTLLGKLDAISETSSEEVHAIVMGDFNDDPRSESIQNIMHSGLFINPMEKLLSPYSGSANYKGKWNLFDQIILSHSFLNHEAGTHSFQKAAIFAPRFLKEWKGRYKGNPYRTYAGRKYLGGYSDHFPVYVVMRFNEKR